MERTALAWMRQPPAAVPERFDLRVIGPVLWQALLHDGVTRHVWGHVAIPADRLETPDIRAGALQALVPPRGVVGRRAAAWVHTGGPRPPRIDVLVAPGARRPDPHPDRVPHECALPADDVVVRGSLRVTTVERTAVDVARWVGRAEARRVLDRLVRVAGLDPARALDRLDALAGHCGVHEAHATLASLAAAAGDDEPRGADDAGTAGQVVRAPLTPRRSRSPRARRRRASP